MKLRKGVSGAWVALLAAAVDRVAKVFAARMNPGEVVSIIPGVLRLRSVTNTGMAFGLFSGQTLLLTIAAVLMTAVLAAWLIAKPQSQSRWLRAGLWMVVGGGMGNLYDRIVYGHVIDFIEPTFVRFAVFNSADMFICVGAGIAALAMILEERKREPIHE